MALSSATSPTTKRRHLSIIGLTAGAVAVIALATFVIVRLLASDSTTTATGSTTTTDRTTATSDVVTPATAIPTLTAPQPTKPTVTVASIPSVTNGPGASALPRTTTSLGNDLGPSHTREIAAIDKFYQAVVARDWDYTRAHFVNGEGNGPNKDDAWWSSQYGLITEYTLAPMRVDADKVRVGIVTHEIGMSGDSYSHVICIPFVVSSNDFVRQAGKASIFDTIPGEFIDPSTAMARLQSC